MKEKTIFEAPRVGDRVRLRGRAPSGTLRSVNAREWAEVDWDDDTPGPELCHLRELMKAGI